MITESADHHGSHRHLLWEPESARHAHVDAIVVPTIRPSAHLADAAKLAATLRCPLVTLHSGKWTSAAEAVLRVPPDVELIAVDLPHSSQLALPRFRTSRLLAERDRGRFVRKADTSAKRNLALMLARMVGWKRIVFLDDDIEVGDPDDLTQAAGLLDTYDAVGLSIGGYPDNSVVCHAYREVGGPQHSFVGGGALAVETFRTPSFFPNIYNEDWFYLLDAKLLHPLAVTGTVIQRPYDPYRTPERARAQEFGDVLAEGVFWLLDQGGCLADADIEHWTDFLARRGRFITSIVEELTRTPVSPARDRMIEALKAARGRLAYITPGLCKEYLEAWALDRKTWEQHVCDLPTGLTWEAALRLLAGPGARQPTSYIRRPGRASRQASTLLGAT